MTNEPTTSDYEELHGFEVDGTGSSTRVTCTECGGEVVDDWSPPSSLRFLAIDAGQHECSDEDDSDDQEGEDE